MQISSKTGLVLKISLVLVILLGAVLYKLNDYFQNDKYYSMQSQLRSRVVLVKTTVSSQLAQLRNTLSSYENELSDTNINWVQLDPFFAVARLNEINNKLQVSQMLVRSNTPAERWNAAYFEKALTLNQSKENNPILVQLFQDRSGEKFIIVRFKTAIGQEVAVASSANYFQKFFDINRGDSSVSLLATTEDMLAAHSEGDYIASSTQETRLSVRKYVIEKEEIVGTNLIAMNYIPKKKIASGFAVPLSIVGVVSGVGCLLIAVLFYALDPMEKKVERYKRQERAQIYKDTVGGFVAQVPILTAEANKAAPPSLQTQIDTLKAKIESAQIEEAKADMLKNKVVNKPVPVEVKPEPVMIKAEVPPKDFFAISSTAPIEKKVEVQVSPESPKVVEPVKVEVKPEAKTPVTEESAELKQAISGLDELLAVEKVTSVSSSTDQFLAINEDSLDLTDIEKALALDDFDNDESSVKISSDRLEKTLTPQKISVSPIGAPIDKPNFALEKKEFKVDEIKVNIRRPERI